MFEIGEYIICGSNGVCRVTKIGSMNLPGTIKGKLYYSLEPVYTGGSVIYTPVDNEKMIMRPILKKEEANQLILQMREIETLWIQDEKRREELFKNALRTCDCRELVKIIKTLYLRKQSRLAHGKKEISSDEKYLRLAEDNLYGELAISLEMPKEQVERFVCDTIEQLEADQS